VGVFGQAALFADKLKISISYLRIVRQVEVNHSIFS
jgi:hypothetical protein